MKRSVHALYRHSEDYMDESPMSTILPKLVNGYSLLDFPGKQPQNIRLSFIVN